MASSIRPACAVLTALSLAACFGGGGITPIQTAFNRGVYQESVGDYDAAIAEYREALEENPDDHRARFNLGFVYEAKPRELAVGGDSKGAEQYRQLARREYELLLEEVPDHPRASVNLAAMRYAEDPEASDEMLRGLIERHPDRAQPRTALAAHLLAKGKPEEAIALLEEANRLEPAHFQTNLLLGDGYRALGDVDMAREAYTRALRRDDSDLSALMALASLEIDDSKPDAAASYLERILFVDPYNFRAHIALAQVREGQGDLESAVVHLLLARRQPDAAADREEIGEHLQSLYRRLLEADESAGASDPDREERHP